VLKNADNSLQTYKYNSQIFQNRVLSYENKKTQFFARFYPQLWLIFKFKKTIKNYKENGF
jgi:hypothetical protein